MVEITARHHFLCSIITVEDIHNDMNWYLETLAHWSLNKKGGHFANVLFWGLNYY